MSGDGFERPEEKALADRFLGEGHVILPAEDRAALARIRGLAAAVAGRELGEAPPDDPGPFLDRIHERIDPARLNDFRLAVIAGMNAEPWLRPAYFATARSALEVLVGNELAMQRRLNLSIQLPGDDSSLLPVHADVWSGDSPFEVVLWLPLVDCYRTRSMFLLPPAANAAMAARLHEFAGRGVEALYRAIEADLVWLEVPCGQVLLFNQNLAHGNRVNREADSRWSMNGRFKGVFTPYAGKRLGEFFEPITLRPASRIGLAHALPRGFGAAGVRG